MCWNSRAARGSPDLFEQVAQAKRLAWCATVAGGRVNLRELLNGWRERACSQSCGKFHRRF